MNEFAKFIKSRREALGWSPKQFELEIKRALGRSVNDSPNADLISKWENSRILPKAYRSVARELLCKGKEQGKRFDELLAAARESQAKGRKTRVLFNAQGGEIQIFPLKFPEPVTGETDFASAFVDKLFKMAGFAIKPIIPDGEPTVFEKKVEWLQKSPGNSAMITLSSLSHLRDCNLFPFPVQLSINGVILIDDEQYLPHAKALLTGDTCEIQFKLISPIGSVGHDFLEVQELMDRHQTFSPNERNPKNLAEMLAGHASQRPLLCTDELTALAVVEHLGGRGCLILPPTTDMTLSATAERLRMPAHFLSLAVLRSRDVAWRNFLQDAFSIFLSHEPELISTMMKVQYEALVTWVKQALSIHPHLFVGGTRRLMTSEYAGDPDNVETEIDVLLEQEARAFARCALKVSLPAIKSLPLGFRVWENILLRSRQRIALDEARDRRYLREVLQFCIAMALKKDPTIWNRSWKSPEGIVNLDDELSRAIKQGQLIPLLSREFDLEENVLATLKVSASTPFEAFLSDIQDLLEESSGLKGVSIDVEPQTIQSGADEEAIGILRATDRESRQVSSFGRVRAFGKSKIDGRTAVVAYAMGEPVGLLEYQKMPIPKSYDGPIREPLQAFKITNFFIVEHMRISGAGRRLLRHVVKLALLQEDIGYILLDNDDFTENVRERFDGYGFRKLTASTYVYYQLLRGPRQGVRNVTPRVGRR